MTYVLAVFVALLIPRPGIETASDNVVINEFMAHPTASATQHLGEYIELYNNSNGYINLSGWTISNSYGDEVVLGTYLLGPESYYVVGTCGDLDLNGGYEADYVCSDLEIRDHDHLRVRNASGNLVTEVDFDSSWPIVDGESCEFINPGWVSTSASSWSTATTTYGKGDYGTPGTQNSVYENNFAQNSWAFIKAFVQ
ncbi:hypothetical protein GF402_06745 [Candidatus Fermentibacteria bacterium]|nr:hypothetical protein [Candidatus Fermentibacteria bacterium]